MPGYYLISDIRPPAVPRCPCTWSWRSPPPPPGDGDGDGPGEPLGGGAGGSRGLGPACLPPSVYTLLTSPPRPRVTGTVGRGSLAGAQILPFFTRSSRVSGKLRQPRCLPRHPFLLLSLRQGRENNRQHFFLCGWRKGKDYR